MKNTKVIAILCVTVICGSIFVSETNRRNKEYAIRHMEETLRLHKKSRKSTASLLRHCRLKRLQREYEECRFWEDLLKSIDQDIVEQSAAIRNLK